MIATAILRSVQAVFAAVVLGLAAAIVKDQIVGSNPTVSYAAFTGGFGMIAAFVGFAALFIEPLSGLVMSAVDALASLLFLAGGIAIAVKLRGINCSSKSQLNWANMSYNDMLNGGCLKVQGEKRCAYADDRGKLMSRCKEVQADSIFQFFSFLICISCAVLALLAMKRGTAKKGVIV